MVRSDNIATRYWANMNKIIKIKEINSKDLEIKLKLSFFQFFKLNANNKFIIADISLV